MPMDKPLVSIIIPIYNAAPHLAACIESVRKQTYQELEILLVNDGSDDVSLPICQMYARVDNRIRIIDKPNSGVSATRNAAIDRAAGAFLQFVDADDFLAPDATEKLVHAAQSTGADLVISHFYRLLEDRAAPKGHIKGERLLTRAEFAEEMVKAPANFYYGVLWNKLYRRSIAEAHRLRFDREVSWCEDFLFNLEYIKYARLIAAVPHPVYYYVKRESSAVNQVNLRQTIEMKRTTFACYKALYQALDLYEEQKLGVYRYLVTAATDGGTLPPLELPSIGKKPREHKE